MKTYLILIADDEPANIQIIVESLSNSDLNHKIIRATNGKILCELAEKRMPDLIITDWEMPEMNGIEAIKKLKSNEITKDIPVVMCTGIMTTAENLKLALMSGAVDYIRKPVNPIELEARVRSMLLLNDSYLFIKEQHLQIQLQKNELEVLNETKDRFFSIIAHDLRGPFISFLGLTDLLTRKMSTYSYEQMFKLALQMKNSAYNLSQLLENLLEWSRMQRNMTIVSRTSIKPHDIVNSNIELVAEAAVKKGVKILNNVPVDIKICADVNLFQSVVRNLISNALKFSHENDSIIIAAEKTIESKVIFTVKDTGVGMSEKVMGSLFKLDGESNRRGTHNEPSSGLGLILCKEFVEKMNAELWVESVEGSGSTFYVQMADACH